jgi:hypothetical protein
MAWSVLDLSIITDELIALLRDTIDPASAVWKTNGGPIDFFHVTVSGAMPETDRDGTGCLLSLYLLHISQDPTFRNTPVSGPLAQTNRSQPLSLDLYYLLTSFANKNYNQEQQAMSLAMRCFHERTIMHVLAPQQQEYSITMEVQNADEMSRLWQALSTPFRLSVVYKVSIVFVTPSQPPIQAAPLPTAVGVAVVPRGVISSVQGRIFGAAVRESFAVPGGATAANADTIPSTIVPGLVRPGDDLIVTGAGFSQAHYSTIYLAGPGQPETDITAWRQSPVTDSTLRLRFPKTVGAAPGAVPPPDNYLLTVGSDGPKLRTNAAAVAIAPRIDGLLTPPQLMPDGGGFYTVHGAGLTAAKTDVRLGDMVLAPVAATPAAGQFQVAADGSSFTFKPPGNIPAGRYFVGISVNQIPAPPSWYVVVP